VLRERWLLWKAGLYVLEVTPLRGCSFQTSGLAYDIWSLSNHPGFSTMFFGISTYTFLLLAAGIGATDISVSICSYLLETSFMICKDSSRSDNASISFVLLELVLVPLCSFHYTCFVPNG